MPWWFTSGPPDQGQPTATASASRRRSHSPLISSSTPNLALASAIQAAVSSDDGSIAQGWGGGVGGHQSRILSAGAARADGGKPLPDWDAHGLVVTTLPVPFSRLDGKKRYKVSELTFLDRRARTRTAAAEDPLFDDGMPALRPAVVYTRSQLLHELDALASSSMFDHITLQSKPKPDGTLGLTVSYAETEWPAADRLKLINVSGHMARRPANDELELDDDMTARERMHYLRRQEREHRQLVRRAKPCILPETCRGS